MAHFYNESTKKYIVAFSKLFSDFHVKRYDSEGIEVKDIKVPLVYASKRKISYLLQQNENTKAASIVLPSIGFNIEGITYSSERKLNSLNEISVSDTHSMYEGVPYDYDIEVTVRTKYQDDYWQIIEQILYLFKPELTLDVKELDYDDFKRDVMVTLESVTLEDELELDQAEDSVRSFRAGLGFKLKGYIYPTSTEDKVIHHVDVNFYTDRALTNLLFNISHDYYEEGIIYSDIWTLYTTDWGTKYTIPWK